MGVASHEILMIHINEQNKLYLLIIIIIISQLLWLAYQKIKFPVTETVKYVHYKLHICKYSITHG